VPADDDDEDDGDVTGDGGDAEVGALGAALMEALKEAGRSDRAD
jgi:hypothetical protein